MIDDETRRNLALSFVAGLVEGDLDRLRSAVHPDATWTVPGSTSISGVARGADMIVDRAQAISDSDVIISLQDILVGLDSAAVLLHNTGQRGATRLDETVVVVFAFDDDTIVSADNVISDVPGLDAFFAAADD